MTRAADLLGEQRQICPARACLKIFLTPQQHRFTPLPEAVPNSERPTRVLTPRVGLSKFSRRQAALKQELVFALLAVDGLRLQCPHPTEGVSLPGTLQSRKCARQANKAHRHASFNSLKITFRVDHAKNGLRN